MIVVDEAYQEFSGEPSLIRDLGAHDNLIVLRTLSKAYGLAGARCAAILGQPELIACLRKVMAAYPIPRPSVDAVLEAISPDRRQQHFTEIEILKTERERMASALNGNPKIRKIFPSTANFLLLDVHDVDSFMACLRAAGIAARDRRCDWPNAVRLTIGTPAENNRVLRALT